LKRLLNSMYCHRSLAPGPAPDLLAPELRAALGVAEGAFLLDPHRAGQDQVGGQR
jgi:hypothetical protein